MPELEDALARLDRLELQYRRMRRVGVVVAVLLGTAVIAEQAAPRWWPGRVVTAERFYVADRRGTERAMLGMDETGRPLLALLGEQGEQRIRATLTGEPAAPELVLDAGDEKLISLGIDSTGTLGLNLSTENAGIVHAIRSDEAPAIFVQRGPGQTRAIVAITQPGRPAVILQDARGRTIHSAP